MPEGTQEHIVDPPVVAGRGAALCGEIQQLRVRHSGEVLGNCSAEKTSRQAERSRPACSAPASASSSTSSPRPTLTTPARTGSRARRAAPARPRVSGVSGHASTSQYADGNSESSASSCTIRSKCSTVSPLRCTPMVCSPMAFSRRPTSLPIGPSPTMMAVCSSRSNGTWGEPVEPTDLEPGHRDSGRSRATVPVGPLRPSGRPASHWNRRRPSGECRAAPTCGREACRRRPCTRAPIRCGQRCRGPGRRPARRGSERAWLHDVARIVCSLDGRLFGGLWHLARLLDHGVAPHIGTQRVEICVDADAGLLAEQHAPVDGCWKKAWSPACAMGWCWRRAPASHPRRRHRARGRRKPRRCSIRMHAGSSAAPPPWPRAPAEGRCSVWFGNFLRSPSPAVSARRPST